MKKLFSVLHHCWSLLLFYISVLPNKPDSQHVWITLFFFLQRSRSPLDADTTNKTMIAMTVTRDPWRTKIASHIYLFNSHLIITHNFTRFDFLQTLKKKKMSDGNPCVLQIIVVEITGSSSTPLPHVLMCVLPCVRFVNDTETVILPYK